MNSRHTHQLGSLLCTRLKLIQQPIGQYDNSFFTVYNPLSISPSTTNQRITSDPGIIQLSYLDDCHGLLQGEGGLEPLGQLDGLLLCDLVVTGMARPQLLHPTGVELRSAIHLLKAS